MKTTTEHNEYGIQHPDGTVSWATPERRGRSVSAAAAPGWSGHAITNGDGAEYAPGIERLKRDLEKIAASVNATQHLPAGTVKPGVIVRRSVLTVYGDIEEV